MQETINSAVEPKFTLDIYAIHDRYKKNIDNYEKRITFCAGTGCIANGALKILEKFREELAVRNLDYDLSVDYNDDAVNKNALITGSGCQGFCQVGPLVTIGPDDIFYVKVKPEDVAEIIDETLVNGRIIDRLLFGDNGDDKKYNKQHEIPFYAKQNRKILNLCGIIDPDDINEYIGQGGYQAAKKVLQEMEPTEVCDVVKKSGLRGRGGGGFLTGFKWELAQKEQSEVKYIICNGDEGDPGAFMDRSLMEGNPHAVLEGMIIAAKAIGAHEGYLYIRAEYPLAVSRIKKAVEDAKNLGILGDNSFNTGYAITLHVMEGAGAFVCGEETALIASIEGNRGMPQPKPPFPTTSGLWGKPTVTNNVETFASIATIINEGYEAFKALGTENSPGTKTFALTGHVLNTGLIEVPFGITLREIIFEIGGGVINKDGKVDNNDFKAVQIGGPSGACLTEEHLDIPLDFGSLTKIGAMVGSGGLVVINKSSCMIQIAKFFMQFTQHESCGKCVPCREGTKQILNMLDDIIEGRADDATLVQLERVSNAVKKSSLCGLGKSAPNPILSTLKNFGDEYRAHIEDKHCPTAQCTDLVDYIIDSEKCRGCTLCMRKCPVGAIAGEKKMAHIIDHTKCIKCGVCLDLCKFDAVYTGKAE